MNRTVLLLAAATTLGAAPAAAQHINGAGLPGSGRRAPDGPITPGRPLPVNPPTAPAQKPAFAGQWGAPAVVTRTPIA